MSQPDSVNEWLWWCPKRGKFSWIGVRPSNYHVIMFLGGGVPWQPPNPTWVLLSTPLPPWSGGHPCYLLVQSIGMTVLSKHRRHWAVMASLWIPCGVDSMLGNDTCHGEGSPACLIISQPHTTGMEYLSPSL